MKPIEWLGDKIKILDQTKLPGEIVFLELGDYRDVVTAIKDLKVRGAPAIGVAAGYGIALGARSLKTRNKKDFFSHLEMILQCFAESRPTAVNLFHAIQRMKQVTIKYDSIPLIKEALIDEALKIHAEEESATESLSKLGAQLIKDGFTIMTHCNAGALATAGYGTALGIVFAARAQGKNIKVIATETRPLLQGARLTIWELLQENIPATLITDSMAGYFLHQGKVDCVIVGADRIAANGDTANKIGTYSLAVLALENKTAFYVAAPTSTVDLSINSGAEIPIEERHPEEVTSFAGVRTAPEGARAANPAFDVTPHHYITAIITEKGIATRSYEYRLRKLLT
jgi:methylthioribose-1-phosphate isomerase